MIRSTNGSPNCSTASTCRIAAGTFPHSFPVVRNNGSGLPARSRCGRRCCCPTRPPRASIPPRRSRSWPCSVTFVTSSASPSSSSRTRWRWCGRSPTRWPASTRAASSKAVRSPTSSSIRIRPWPANCCPTGPVCRWTLRVTSGRCPTPRGRCRSTGFTAVGSVPGISGTQINVLSASVEAIRGVAVGRAVLAISPSAPAGFTSYLRDRGLHVRAGAHAAAKDAA
ncbi:hypothetical protein LOC73_18655 [Mycolicibacterium mageritense]|nr:NIL domain-containing protein [Mycolicibacterium mageritense]MCC9182699.1 hypothetical protein [Mycolicibacterium mageritense]